jgi:hypothetical protein
MQSLGSRRRRQLERRLPRLRISPALFGALAVFMIAFTFLGRANRVSGEALSPMTSSS